MKNRIYLANQITESAACLLQDLLLWEKVKSPIQRLASHGMLHWGRGKTFLPPAGDYYICPEARDVIN